MLFQHPTFLSLMLVDEEFFSDSACRPATQLEIEKHVAKMSTEAVERSSIWADEAVPQGGSHIY